MGVPQIPRRTLREALTDVIESIALEEAAMAHLINAEAEKAQFIAHNMSSLLDDGTLDDILQVQKSISRLLDQVIRKQDILLEKLRLALEVIGNELPSPEEIKDDDSIDEDDV